MILIVNEQFEIPHLVGKDSFNPFCEVDDIRGKSMVDAYPKVYREISKEELASLDVTKWKRLDALKGKTLKEAVELLTEPQKKVVLDFVGTILNPKVPEPPRVKILEEMTVPELRSFAKKNNIEIPDTATKKAEILEVIKQAQKI
jgi:hypothetical protein